MGDDAEEFLAWSVLFMAVVGIAALLVALLWKFLLAGLVLWGLVKLALAVWRESDLRREREHRRRLAAIAQIRRDTVAAMVEVSKVRR